MSDRYFSEAPIDGEITTLTGPEAHHLLHVMRGKVGQKVVLFDGGGAEFEGEIARTDRSSVEVRIVARREIDRELAFPLIFGVALPKGDRQKWLVEKLTELGVTALVPLASERAVAQPNGRSLERLRRWSIEAAKQCGRNRLMRIEEAQSWHQWIATAPDGARRWIAHRTGKPLAELYDRAANSARVAIGPEGGFTHDEVKTAVDADWQVISLGTRILRIETAAIALASTLTLGVQG